MYALNVDEDQRGIQAFLDEAKVSVPVLLDANATVAEKTLRVLKVIPEDDKSGIILSKIWIDEANLLAPLTLMTPLATIGLGVLITQDHFDLRMAVGGGLAMLGVLIVAIRRKPATQLLVEREVR